MSKNSQQRLLARSTKPTLTPYRRRKRFRHRWQRSLHYFYLRFLRLRGSPENIAKGLAAGVFAGLFPLIATQSVVAILIAASIRGNKIVAAAATWISNPFTALPIYAFNFQVGRWLLGSSDRSFSIKNLDSWQEMSQLGTGFLVDLFLGCFVVASICSVATYFLGLRFVRRLRKKRSRRAKASLY